MESDKDEPDEQVQVTPTENKPNFLTPQIPANEVNSTVQALIVQDPVGKAMGHDLGKNTQEWDIM